MDPIISLSAPVMVDFEVIDKCPYKCFFCEGDIPKHELKHINCMDSKQCFKVLEKIADAGVLNVFLTGGEPLLREDIHLLIKKAYDLNLEPSISTTLYPLNKEKLENLVDVGLKYLQVSIQGMGKIHESIVGKRSYERITENLKKVLDAGINVNVTTVGLKENLPYIPSFIKEISKIGVKYFRVLRLVTSHDKQLLDHIPSREMAKQLIGEIRKSAEENNIDLLLSFCPGLSDKFPSYMFEGIHPATHTCPAGKTEFAILSNGDTYPCVALKNSLEFKTGNILENTVTEIWNHPAMKKMRELTPVDYNGECGKCERKWTCYSARCVAYNLTGDIRGDDISCYFIREKNKP